METEKEKENQSEYYYNKLKNLIFNDAAKRLQQEED